MAKDSSVLRPPTRQLPTRRAPLLEILILPRILNIRPLGQPECQVWLSSSWQNPTPPTRKSRDGEDGLLRVEVL